MLNIEVTNICNYKCYFCTSQFVTQHKTMTFDQYKNIVNEAYECGIRTLDFTPVDGEVFVDPNFIEKLEYATNRFNIRFYTNFSLCTPEIQDKLKRLQSKNTVDILVSNYGNYDKDLYMYQTRQNEKTWSRFQENLQYAKKIDLNIDILYRGSDYNFSFDNTNENISDEYKIKTRVTYEHSGFCAHQLAPRLDAFGDMYICRCADGKNEAEDLLIGNIYNSSFKELYFNKMRYTFFKEQTKGIYSNTCKGCCVFEKAELDMKNIINFNYMKNL